MILATLLTTLSENPENVSFEQVMDVIAQQYNYSPSSFNNGKIINEAGTNEGSCKIFSFAKLNELTPEQTLSCFGRYYREDVLQHPNGEDHGNIRNFMITGWEGIQFDSEVLTEK